MLFLDRIPAYAAVDEAVEMIQLRFGNNFSRLANGVLRNIQRAPYEWPPVQSLVEKKDLKTLAQMFSHPEWLIKRWTEQYGWKETAALVEANNRIPAVTIRVVRPKNNLKPWLEQMAAREVRRSRLNMCRTLFGCRTWTISLHCRVLKRAGSPCKIPAPE
jgi:16S rRNA (cytosine967-C5)-methyltransferase